MSEKSMTLGQAKTAAYYSYKAGEVSLFATNKYMDFLKSLEADGENFNDNNTLQFLLINRLEKHYNEVYAERHNGALPKKITFTDSKTAREAIARYVSDVALNISDSEKYTLTDVVGIDIVDHLHAWYTSYNSEYELDDFVLDYMEDSGVKLGRDKQRDDSFDEYDNNFED